jgi:hypothetical protein
VLDWLVGAERLGKEESDAFEGTEYCFTWGLS